MSGIVVSSVEEFGSATSSQGSREKSSGRLSYFKLYLVILLAIISGGVVFRIWFGVEMYLAFKAVEDQLPRQFRSR